MNWSLWKITVYSQTQLNKNKKSIKKQTTCYKKPTSNCNRETNNKYKKIFSHMKKVIWHSNCIHNTKIKTMSRLCEQLFDKILKSDAITEKKWCGCGLIYVEHSNHHVATRVSKERFAVDPHIAESCGAISSIELKIQDNCRTVEKLMTFEALYIDKLKQGLKTCGSGNWLWELTQKCQLKKNFWLKFRAEKILFVAKTIIQNPRGGMLQIRTKIQNYPRNTMT